MASHLSELPDSLLELIFSFLPTKQAITTCLLSKTWSNLRLSLPTIDIDDFNFHSLHSFLQYADKVMSMRDDSQPIKKFHLRCTCRSVPRVKINTWINTAVHSKVEHVVIHDKTLNKFNIDVPSSIFNCNTITILQLSGVTVTTTLSFVDLPSVKVLHLDKVIFSNIECVCNLLYGCPLLQDLALKYCCTTDRDWYLPVPIQIERLKNLVSADVYDYPFTLESLSNLTALRINTIGRRSVDHPLTATFYNLIHMNIRYYSTNAYGRTILQCLQNFPKLETLIIDEYNCTQWLNESDVPQCVSSHLKEFHLGNYRGLDNELELLGFIMKKANFLKIFSIHRHVTSTANSKQEMLRRLSYCPKSSVNCRILFK